MPSINDLSKHLLTLQKQIPFAMARAMTNVVRQIQEAEKKGIQRNLDNPTPFTVNAVGSVGARKDNLVAKVFVRDIAASYLQPFEFGGMHKLNSSALLNPKDIKLNKYGNLPRTKLSQLKARNDVFIGKVDGVDGVWQRKKVKKSKGKKRSKRSKNGTHQEKQKSCSLKLLIRFGDSLPVSPKLGYFDRANDMVKGLMPSTLSKEIEEAIRTAR